jgi:hypothetical protein
MIKMYLKKAWVWLKNHWYVPVFLLAACVIWFFYRQKAAAMFDNLVESRKAHKEEIEELNKIQAKETASRDKNLKNYLESEDKLEEKLAKDKLAAAKERKDREEELMKKEIHDIAKELAKKEHLK